MNGKDADDQTERQNLPDDTNGDGEDEDGNEEEDGDQSMAPPPVAPDPGESGNFGTARLRPVL